MSVVQIRGMHNIFKGLLENLDCNLQLALGREEYFQLNRPTILLERERRRGGGGGGAA